ncbi:type II toxin-antitoxin system RelB/DinJ family antitoxin [Alcanivorax quisquiliarum]|uniref:Type II toxin-antitoxin system RelB/DinJ family antitoxin n=1 Tax=Alcanivorax quisquiliarum TaxID=2933565 RepID=A0ABT0EB85_9GAMM|nr:type II toxin-antitoxin system RelB/DinJ family antitoxin [Alcanivorax quisquiliarum]MCK0538874.1 type II toxin-antitoxin system RelB/DinJ family antitoxin [Alcanivorax quisquiliarum]
MDTYVRARIDSDLKASVEVLCSKMGISVSDYIRLSFYQLLETRTLPGVKVPNAETQAAMAEVHSGGGERGNADDFMAAIGAGKKSKPKVKAQKGSSCGKLSGPAR